MTMARSAARQAASTAQKVKGKAEEMAGRVTGDHGLHARGVLDQTMASLKHVSARVRQSGERAARKVSARRPRSRHT